MIFEHIEEHNQSLSKKIQDIVHNVRELESRDEHHHRQFQLNMPLLILVQNLSSVKIIMITVLTCLFFPLPVILFIFFGKSMKNLKPDHILCSPFFSFLGRIVETQEKLAQNVYFWCFHYNILLEGWSHLFSFL